jgi:hypothetical protein
MPTKQALANSKKNQPIAPADNGNNHDVASRPTPQTAEERLLARGGGLLTLEQVAVELNEDKRIIEYQCKLGELIAVDMNGEYQYPAWQFQDGKLLTGLDRVLAALKENDATPWTKIIFMTTENAGFDGRTPLDCLKSGNKSDIEEVVMEARREGQQGA